jgi:hypothetical protein
MDDPQELGGPLKRELPLKREVSSYSTSKSYWICFVGDFQ